jgi:hypothetical protein
MAICKTRTSILSTLGLILCAALLPAAGCAGQGDPPDVGEDDGSPTGIARLSVQAVPTSAGEITRVTVTSQDGHEAELARDASDNFVGSLLLPAGSNQIVGDAFVGDELVGSSAPVSVEIQAGVVTQATLRILDVTAAQDVAHSPFVLSVSYPLTAVVNQPAPLAITAADPDGDPLSVAWSSDCADGTFSAPTAFATDFTKPSAGACHVSVSVSDGELSASETFSIAVFEESQAQGAVNVNGQFIVRPTLSMHLQWADAQCSVNMSATNGSCQQAMTTPNLARVHVYPDWGNSSPGTVEVTDNCGGVSSNTIHDPYYFVFQWRPPAVQAACLITALATNGDGVSSRLSAAVVVRPEQAE